MFQACQYVLKTLRKNAYADEYITRFIDKGQSYIRSKYLTIVNNHRAKYWPEEIAFAAMLEFCYSSPSMRCDVLYKPITEILLPGAGLLDNESEFNFMISYVFKRGLCDEIFKKYDALLDRVRGVMPDMELVCDIFDVGERHLELQLFESLLTIVNYFY